jgi:hypothetical protein
MPACTYVNSYTFTISSRNHLAQEAGLKAVCLNSHVLVYKEEI